MTALVLALAMGVADAGVDFSDSLYATCPEAPPLVVLDGGAVLLPELRAARVACLMATCEDARRRKVEELEPPPLWWIALAGALAVGVGVGVFLPRPW